MGLIDTATAPLRYVLHAAESEAEKELPVKDIVDIQSHVLGGVEAIKDATEQMASQLEMFERLTAAILPLAAAIGPLTEAVTLLTQEVASVGRLTDSVDELTERLGVVSEVLAPLAHVEADLGKVGHLFSRRKPNGDDPAS